MHTDVDRATYKFITEYSEQNGGATPSYATVTAKVEGFEYIPEVSDAYTYLAREIKGYSAKQAVIALFRSGEFERKLNDLSGEEFIERWLPEITEGIRAKTAIKSKVGRTLTEIKGSFLEEYEDRKSGKSNKRWDTPFKPLTKEISGWFAGDVYGIMAESGRGKTYLIIKIIDSLLRQGANVLVKSYEVKEYVWIARLISIISAVDEVFVDDLGRRLGIPNKQILSAKLEGLPYEEFTKLLVALDSYYPGKLYFQGKSDPNMTRTLDDLDRELKGGGIDAVFLDPFYGLSDVYGKNANNTTGGSAEYAATRFENIIGDNDVVGFYAVQATVEKKTMDEDDVREMNLPTRDQVKTSKRLLDIATNLISFDSIEKEGRAMVGIEKGRNGGEDFRLELMALFDYGVLKELETGEAVAAEFNF
ncbi:DNA helicase [Sporosarcina sp. E16_3]|uniref:DnaB-like helicase C-terminal domain-containing protein n=1 Tax=Sporosarcina sp. E16_3 TaxID=2789293 RepID=UPI001A92631E|nr:DnaB-like helicase C-terminal domain-containing protein [Sporosarcina sp. E16_3]MBO0602749.1 DNA helicase [Sporosarcina sp. E16_3]